VTYLDIAGMTRNESLGARLSAAAAQEQANGAVLIPDMPESWASFNRWKLAAAPGWADAWASAEAAGNPDPGADEAVITDPMILSQVQAVIAAG
jgi:hypothetical protein